MKTKLVAVLNSHNEVIATASCEDNERTIDVAVGGFAYSNCSDKTPIDVRNYRISRSKTNLKKAEKVMQHFSQEKEVNFLWDNQKIYA